MGCIVGIMENKQITETNTSDLLNIVLNDEKENGCSDRMKLSRINMVILSREGKTVNQLLSDRGL